MKRLFAVLLVAVFAISAAAPKCLRTVTFKTSLDCKKCAEKIQENISFERGVKDLLVDLPEKTVTVTFDGSKTDTLVLRRAINKLGYSASVISFK